MRVALINENSQGAKNGVIHHVLKKVANHYGYEMDNHGMYTVEDQAQLTYVQMGILAAAPLNNRVAGYMVTGYGIGEDAMLTCNSFPDVIYDHVEDALDAYIFAQINDGNVITLPFTKGFGWGGDLSLEYVFERLSCEPSGQGYPREKAMLEQKSKKILDEVHKVTFKEDLVEIFRGLDQKLVKGVFTGEKFPGLFFETYKDEKLVSYTRGLLAQL